MDQQNISPENLKNSPIKINFDDFNISEESFKPVTKGLGFHQEQKRQNAFKSVPKEVKPFTSSSAKIPTHPLLNEISANNKASTQKSVPSGLEAFYGQTNTTAATVTAVNTEKLFESVAVETQKYKSASSLSQFFAWAIDIALVASFSIITTTLLILVSGMSFQAFLRVIPVLDLTIFGSVLFSIYYLLYFTILDLSATPGKTIMGIRLVRINNREVSVKHTFTRSLVSLLSFVALFLPMIIDFQGRLSDTKVVK
jgi:uncharacterized RDD family membrane protein YckC